MLSYPQKSLRPSNSRGDPDSKLTTQARRAISVTNLVLAVYQGQGPDPSVCFRNQPGKTKFSPSTESEVVTFHRLRCWYLRLAFFTAKSQHRFETGVAREAACFEIGATSVFS